MIIIVVSTANTSTELSFHSGIPRCSVVTVREFFINELVRKVVERVQENERAI